MRLSLGSLLPPRRRPVAGMAVSLLLVAAIAGALLPFREGMDNATAGLSFVVPVVLATALGGFPSAVVAVTSGFVAYNALFTRPYLTLEVAHVPDVAGLLVYVIAGGTTAAIVSLRQREAAVARRREEEAVTVSELSASLIEGSDVDAILATVATAVTRLFEVRTAVVVTGPDTSRRIASISGEPLPAALADALTDGSSTWQRTARQHRGLNLFPLLSGGTVRGVLAVRGDVPAHGRQVLTTFANHAAMALHRAELAERATLVQVLEESARVRAALLRSVSHDLRTPLASITAGAEELADPGLRLPDDDRRLIATTIAEEAARLDRLVANLLDMSRLETGHLELQRQAVDVQDLVHTVSRAGGFRDLDVHAPVALPPVMVDTTLVEQALRNLLENADRVSPGRVAAVASVAAEPGMVEISIVDHGPGVASGDRERIFEPFERAGSTGGGAGHFGLGLAIARGYVEAHGGTLTLRDTPGGGATFALTLPAADDMPNDVAPSAAGGASP